jgi:microcystin-dependent protein
VLGRSNTVSLYQSETPNTAMSTAAVTTVGGGQSHANVQPFQCINYIIALVGVYPSRT